MKSTAIPTRPLVGLVLVSALLAGCDHPRAEAPVILEGPTMGTRYAVTLFPPGPGIDEQAIAGAIAGTLERIDAEMSTYRDDSELSRFNASASTDWMEVSPDVVRVVDEALHVSSESGGAFDVTVGPLVNLWGFGPQGRPERIPSSADLARARELVGSAYLSTRASPPALRKAKPGLYVDLSAIAKGFAVDRLAALLDAHGVERYLVDIGGELRARGTKPDGSSWTIAIERPVPGERSVQRIVHLRDASIATSGDYRNYFEIDGKRYSHTIDPSTGRPIEHTLASVSVIADTAMRADALATALMVLGVERGETFATANDLAVYMIYKTSDGFDEITTQQFERHLASP